MIIGSDMSLLNLSAFIAKSEAVVENSVSFSESSFNITHHLDRVAFDVKSASGMAELAVMTDVAMNIMQKAMAAYVANMTTIVGM